MVLEKTTLLLSELWQHSTSWLGARGRSESLISGLESQREKRIGLGSPQGFTFSHHQACRVATGWQPRLQNMAHCDTTNGTEVSARWPRDSPCAPSELRATGRERISILADAEAGMTWSHVEHLREEISPGHLRTLQQPSGRMLGGQSQRWKSQPGANPSEE